MENSFEQHRRLLLKEAIEHWDEKAELHKIEDDPVVKLFFSALAYQSYSISREIEAFQGKVVTEFRNKLIPYHLIKPFPALSVIETQIGKSKDVNIKPLSAFRVDEQCVFEFGKNKMPFTPLFSTTIINAAIADIQIIPNNNTLQLTLSSSEVIEDFSGMSFYFEDSELTPDVEILLNDQLLPVIKSDDCDNLPFTDWFQHHYHLSEDNQLQYGNYDYWLEFHLRKNINFCYIGTYNCRRIKNNSTRPVFTIRFKSRLELLYFQKRSIRINCLPIVNVQKRSVVLKNDEPVKKLSAENSVFLNLLVDENTEKNEKNFFIRHFGVERYNQ